MCFRRSGFNRVCLSSLACPNRRFLMNAEVYVLSTIIEEQKDELTIYRGAAQSGTAGFTARVSSMIASLKRSGLSAADVAESAKKMEEENPARGKLGDIARIYAAYEQRMAENWLMRRMFRGKCALDLPLPVSLKGRIYSSMASI